ncbi:MAG: hypothetical protein IKV29_00870 [Alistipes sp.]|nr:hypothetical protein [Alistipes sp.]
MTNDKKQNTKMNTTDAVLEFISGKTDTESAKRLTRGVNSVNALWLLAKMARTVKKNGL